MRIFGMGMPELIVILLVILVIFGPKNLPKLGSALGKAVKGVREGVDSVNSELDTAKTDGGNNNKSKDAETTKKADAPVTATAVVEDVPLQDTKDPQEAPAAAFCSQCGAALETDAKFCKKCGAPNS